MKKTVFLVCAIISMGLTIYSQDMIVTIKNDTLLCKIKSIKSDSSIYYKYNGFDPYSGYFKRYCWSKYAFNQKICIKESDKYFSATVNYGIIPTEHIVLKIFEANEDLLNDIKTGIYTSIAFNQFLYSNKIEKRRELHPIIFSIGLKYSYFSKSSEKQKALVSNPSMVNFVVSIGQDIEAQYADVSLERKSHFCDLLFSLSTNNLHITTLSFIPGIRKDKYSGMIGNLPLEVNAYLLSLGFSLEQELLSYKRSSLLISLNAFANFQKSCRVDYKNLNKKSEITYDENIVTESANLGISYRYYLK